MQISINKERALHYIILYLVVIMQGSALFGKYQDYILIGTFAFCVFYILYYQIPVSKKAFYYIAVLGLLLFAAVLYTDGSLSINSSFNILTRFLLVYVAYNYNKEQCCDRYIKLIVFLAAVSLVFFALQNINYQLVTRVLLPVNRGNLTYYGTFLYTTVRLHPTRNIGIATEPGRCQIYLAAALFLLLFRSECTTFSEKTKRVFCVILIITLITVQSTTGYLSLLILLVGYVVYGAFMLKDEEQRNVYRRILPVVLIALTIFFVALAYSDSDSFIYKYFINKLFDESGSVDLSVSSGSSRIGSMDTDLRIAFENPFGLGFEKYLDVWTSYKRMQFPDTSSCVGLTTACAALGFPVAILLIGFYFYNAWGNRNNIIDFVVLVALFVNISLAQTVIYFPPLMLIFLISSKNSGELA